MLSQTGAALTGVPHDARYPGMCGEGNQRDQNLNEAGDTEGGALSQLGVKELALALTGTRLLPGSRPFASCYGGHQFGNWAGQLGDGRVATLGEIRAGGDRDGVSGVAASWDGHLVEVRRDTTLKVAIITYRRTTAQSVSRHMCAQYYDAQLTIHTWCSYIRSTRCTHARRHTACAALSLLIVAYILPVMIRSSSRALEKRRILEMVMGKQVRHGYDGVSAMRRTYRKTFTLCCHRLMRCTPVHTERRPFAFVSCSCLFFTTGTNKLLGVHKCSEHVYENICSARLSLALVLLQRWRFLCALLDKVPWSQHLTLKGEER